MSEAKKRWRTRTRFLVALGLKAPLEFRLPRHSFGEGGSFQSPFVKLDQIEISPNVFAPIATGFL